MCQKGFIYEFRGQELATFRRTDLQTKLTTERASSLVDYLVLNFFVQFAYGGVGDHDSGHCGTLSYHRYLLSVSYISTNLYCICLSACFMFA